MLKLENFFFIIFLFVLLSFFVSGFFYYLKPKIEEIVPVPASYKNTIKIRGKNLGSKGEININSNYLTKSSILSWTNEEITFKIMENVDSGLLFVKNEKGISNELFLVIDRQVPIRINEIGSPVLFVNQEVKLKVNTPFSINGRNLLSLSGDKKIIFETNTRNHEFLKENILIFSDNKIEFIPPSALPLNGKLFLKIGEKESNKIPFTFESTFFRWNLGNSKIFKIIEEIYIDGDPLDNNINFNIFYLNPLMNERQKVKKDVNFEYSLNSNNLFYKNLKTNKTSFETEVEIFDFNLEIFDKTFLDNIKIEDSINSQDYLKYVKNKKEFYSNYDDLDLKKLLSKINSKSVYLATREIIDVLSNFNVSDNDLSLKDSIKNNEISKDNLIILINLLFLRKEIPLRTVLGLYYNRESKSFEEKIWFQFLINRIGFVPFDIISLIKTKDFSKYFLNVSSDYIEYGYKEDYEKNSFSKGYISLNLIKYKNLEEYKNNFPLKYKFILGEDANGR